MEQKEMTRGKKWLISGITIFVVLCLIFDTWYLVLKYLGKDVKISSTFEAGEVTLADGSSKNFCEVELWKNTNKDGLEMLEIKLNYLLDENRTGFYSQGLQYVGSTEEDGLEWELSHVNQYDTKISIGDWGGGAIWTTKNWNFAWGDYVLGGKASRYNYQSSDDYVHTTGATNPITDDSMFKITLGKSGQEEIYGVQFKAPTQNDKVEGSKKQQVDFIMEQNSDFQYGYRKVKSNAFVYKEIDYYYSYQLVNINYFAHAIYESIKGVSAGTSSNIVFEWGDLFDYYKCVDEKSGRYEEVAQDAERSELLSGEVKSYYSIKVTVHEEGAKQASDSMFNCIHGSDTYNLTGDYTDKNFFYGENLLRVGLNNFDLVKAGGSQYALKLKQTFLDDYLEYADQMFLLIEIDVDALEKDGIEFYGFTTDSGLDKFQIYKIYTLKTVNGELQRSEVTYA